MQTGLNIVSKLQRLLLSATQLILKSRKILAIRKANFMHVSGKQLTNVFFECFIMDPS